eukprot:maker-scaffold874_size86240-snap-gene-0.13 protein:Tk04008 transcript:maker-scaffold874_size86240-snap-gene-0.13-mRNA-1 annotation:"hypothetical protein BRAFLDRAFT_63227"
MERLKDEPSFSENEDLDAMEDLPSPINVEDILGRSGELSDEDETMSDTVAEVEKITVKSELIEQNDHPKTVCLVPNCGRKFVTNVNEGQDMFRFPVQDHDQSRVWIEILGLKNPGDLLPWTMDDDYFVCGLHFTDGVCSQVMGHPSFIPTRFPPGVQPYNVVLLPPLDPQSELSPGDFHEPIAMPTFKEEITFELESDSEIDEPYAKVPIPPNRNEKCEPMAMDKWSQLPTEGDILRAVIAALTQNETVESMVDHVFQLWNKVKCPPIPQKAISTRIAKLVTSLPGLKSTDILGARKAEFANLFDVACLAEERTTAFNYEFYGDQLSTRRMFFTPTGVILKPAFPPGRVKALLKDLKDIILPTWLQLPTTKEVLEVVEKSPFTARTLAKIIRGLWKRARCYPCNLNHVVGKIRAIQNLNQSGPNGTTELFDIAWEKPLRPADFNDVFYEDQKGLRRMFLTPRDIPSTLASKSSPVISNPISLAQGIGDQSSGHSPRPRLEVLSDQVPDSPTISELEVDALKKMVASCRKFGATESPMFNLAKHTLFIHGIIETGDEASSPQSKSKAEARNRHEPASFGPPDGNMYLRNMIAKLKQEREEDKKVLELYRLILKENKRHLETRKPFFQAVAEITHLAKRNQRYRDIIAFYRENTVNPSNTHKVMGVLHQKLLEAQEVIRQYELESTILDMIKEAKQNLKKALSVADCQAVVNQLLGALIEREDLDRGETWTTKEWLDQDALLDVYEAEILDPLCNYEIMRWGSLWEDHAYECPDCHLKLATHSNLEDHQILNCEVRQRCHVCAFKVSPKDLDFHLKGHTQKYDLESPLTCDECQVQAPNLEAMQTHVNDCHSHQVFCICCQRILRSETLMALHWRSKLRRSQASAATTQIVCPYCGKMSPRPRGDVFDPNEKAKTHICENMAHKMLRDPRVEKYLCQECGDQFLTQTKYDYHMSLIHGQGSNVCHICSRSVLKGKLNEHLFTHTLIRPFKCPKCDMTAQSKAVILTHLKGVHREKKPTSDTIELIPEELEKRRRFRKDVKAGIKEFIEPLEQIPGKFVGKDPSTFKSARHRRRSVKRQECMEEDHNIGSCPSGSF